MSGLTIGKLAEGARTKIQTIRYYEEIGLLRPFGRTQGGHRIFDMGDIDRLKFIRHARDLGFSIPAIRELLVLSTSPSTECSAVDAIVVAQLNDVEARLIKLRALRAELKRMVADCRHGRIQNCRVIEVLSNHRHCKKEH